MAYNYQALGEGGNKGGGVSDKFYFAPISAFVPETGIKVPVPPFTTQESEVTVLNDHEFTVNDDGFIEAWSAPNKNKTMAKTVGELGSKKFQQDFECFLPGSYPALHAQMAALINERVLILTKDANCSEGMHYQHGDTCNYAYVESAEFTTGLVDGTEQKGYKITFKNYTNKVLIYKGNITLKQ